MESYIVDSFINKAFKGNLAIMYYPTRKLMDKEMLLVAKELYSSEIVL